MSAEQTVKLTLQVGIKDSVLAAGLVIFQGQCDVKTGPFTTVQAPAVIGVDAADPTANLGAFDILAGFGDNVDHSGKGVGTVNCRTGAAHHFDASDVANRHAPHISLRLSV